MTRHGPNGGNAESPHVNNQKLSEEPRIMHSRSRALIAVIAVASIVALGGCGTDIRRNASASSSSVSSTDTASSSDPSTDTADATDPSDTSSQNPDEYNDMPLGNVITVTSTDNNDRPYTMTVTVGTHIQTSKKAQQEYMDAPKHTYLGFKVTYVCTKGLCDYNPFDFTLRGSDGTQYDSSLGEGFTPELESGTMHRGAKASGWMTYDIKPGTYTAEYSTGDNVASWVIRFR